MAALMAAQAAVLTAVVGAASAGSVVNGYLLIDDVGEAKLQALAANAATLPLNRITVAFFDPTLTYIPGSKTLQYAGLNLTQSGDYGFAMLASAIKALRAGGVDVFLSLGGWNYGCWPYPYMMYSVGGYGTSTPNYWKIQQYGGGDPANCVEANDWCYVCEPKWDYTPVNDFSLFPEPVWSPTWQSAVAYVTAGAGGAAPVWANFTPGTTWTDPATGAAAPVPGQTGFVAARRDPYADIVHLAAELGASGIDLDYEEIWYADWSKEGAAGGPWTPDQLVYKQAAIAADIRANIQALGAPLALAAAVTATSAIAGNWWGGNLAKNIAMMNAWYPDLVDFMASGGGLAQMTYDLSDNEQYHECPAPSVCTLHDQVAFYAGTYAAAGIAAAVGFEIGTPAYPDPTHDPMHQLPLTSDEFASILANTVPGHNAFIWELYKPANSSQVSATTVLQALCTALLDAAPRCSGVIPNVTAVALTA